MTYLPDVNFWLAIAFESHIHHASAKAWFEAISSDECVFCRTTQQGLLRLATNPSAFGDEARTLSEAWRMYDVLLSDSRVSFADELLGLEQQWREYTSLQTYSPKVWSDAYLAAFARTAQSELVTFDKAFGQYADLRLTILQ